MMMLKVEDIKAVVVMLKKDPIRLMSKKPKIQLTEQQEPSKPLRCGVAISPMYIGTTVKVIPSATPAINLKKCKNILLSFFTKSIN